MARSSGPTSHGTPKCKPLLDGPHLRDHLKCHYGICRESYRRQERHEGSGSEQKTERKTSGLAAVAIIDFAFKSRHY